MAYLVTCLFLMLLLDLAMKIRKKRHTSYTGKIDTHW